MHALTNIYDWLAARHICNDKYSTIILTITINKVWYGPEIYEM